MKRIEQNRIEQNRIEQNIIEQNRIEKKRKGKEKKKEKKKTLLFLGQRGTFISSDSSLGTVPSKAAKWNGRLHFNDIHFQVDKEEIDIFYVNKIV